MRIGVVVGEPSGDNLGYEIISELQKRRSDIEFSGMGGNKIAQLPFDSLYHCNQIAYIGFIDPLFNLKKLLTIRKNLVQHFVSQSIDIFIGIDAPEFNFGLEKKLKRHNIKIIHYVSPQLWAWRRGRAKKISQFVDVMLLLFDFERKYYQPYKLHTQVVGHPMAERIAFNNDRDRAKNTLAIPVKNRTLAVLVGSRLSELKMMLPIYLKAVQILLERQPLVILLPLAQKEHEIIAKQIIEQQKCIVPIQFCTGSITATLEAADFAIVTSGTASLECMLHKVPMVVAYRVKTLMYYLLRPFVRPPFFALPNLVAEKLVVPELIQRAATPKRIALELQKYIDQPQLAEGVRQQFHRTHRAMQCPSIQRIADTILEQLPL